jgi:hypothetical protein
VIAIHTALVDHVKDEATMSQYEAYLAVGLNERLVAARHRAFSPHEAMRMCAASIGNSIKDMITERVLAAVYTDVSAAAKGPL